MGVIKGDTRSSDYGSWGGGWRDPPCPLPYLGLPWTYWYVVGRGGMKIGTFIGVYLGIT